MKTPPPLHLVVRISRRAIAWVVAAHLLTASMLLSLPVPAGLRFAGVAGVAFACAFALRPLAGRRAPALLRVGIDRRIAVTARDGRTCEGEVLADSCIGRRLTTVVWRPDGARRARSIVILPDTLPVDDFRRLRVALRYGRSPGSAPGTSGTDAA